MLLIVLLIPTLSIPVDLFSLHHLLILIERLSLDILWVILEARLKKLFLAMDKLLEFSIPFSALVLALQNQVQRLLLGIHHLLNAILLLFPLLFTSIFVVLKRVVNLSHWQLDWVFALFRRLNGLNRLDGMDRFDTLGRGADPGTDECWLRAGSEHRWLDWAVDALILAIVPLLDAVLPLGSLFLHQV
jgi:hypothetical protein